jgi:phage/conjugal plasmid C-4 type zinc finger TraR family protein
MPRKPDPQDLIEALAKQLQAERQALRLRLARLDQERSPGTGEGSAGDNTPTSETMEAVQESVAKEFVFASRDALVSRLKALDRAEARIREGTYGICERCGEPIPIARLRAMPGAIRCVTCAEEPAGRS